MVEMETIWIDAQVVIYKVVSSWEPLPDLPLSINVPLKQGSSFVFWELLFWLAATAGITAGQSFLPREFLPSSAFEGDLVQCLEKLALCFGNISLMATQWN